MTDLMPTAMISIVVFFVGSVSRPISFDLSFIFSNYLVELKILGWLFCSSFSF